MEPIRLNTRGFRGCILTRLRAVQERAQQRSSPEETCCCLSTRTRTVKLYGLLPEQPRRNLACIRIRFLTDPAYVTWRQYFKKACENVEIRMKETPLSLKTCTDDELLSYLPCYPGMARCCVMHHLEHIQSSLILSLDVCEIEMEAASVYAAWLIRQLKSDKTPTSCWLKEVESTAMYMEAVLVRLDKVRVSRLAYGSTHHALASPGPAESWRERLILQRVAAELPGNTVEDVLTPFPIKRKMTEAELEREEARLSRMSRNEIELEKVHPERIEFLRYLFEGLKSKAGEQAKMVEDEFIQQDRGSGGRRRRRSCPRYWLTEEPRRPRQSIQCFFDFLQPPRAAARNTSVTNEPSTSSRQRSNRRSRQRRESPPPQRERRGTVLLRDTTMSKRRREGDGTDSNERETQESTDGRLTGVSDCEGQWN